MRHKKAIITGIVFMLVSGGSVSCVQGNKGLKSIRAGDMEFHMKYLAADEFRGRNTPSAELKIASRYIALTAERIGLKPLFPGGSFLQEIPLDLLSVSEPGTGMKLTTASGQKKFPFPQSFGIRTRTPSPGSASGEIVFLGLGICAPEMGWDNTQGQDLEGKVALFLDVDLPEDHLLKPEKNRRLFSNRASEARQKGAVAALSVISCEREAAMAESGLAFDNPLIPRLQEEGDTPPSPVSSPLDRIEIRHALAASILGISEEDLAGMFETISSGRRLESSKIVGTTLDINIQIETSRGVTQNVVAFLEGTDPLLKQEYVLFGSHHDGIGFREGRIFNGADDNISGVAAMFELAEAIKIQRPKRSAIFVWHTGEEKGLWGAYQFLAHSPVPVEKMSAELNMDMISRNDPNSIYLIGSNQLSSELDAAIHRVNEKHIKMILDYTYEDPGHPDRFFFRSDHYPYIRYGIPAVWFFCGTTEDYHQETDEESKADYKKMQKVTRFVYLTAMEIANRSEILKLDLHPQVQTRGATNMEINWRPAQTDNLR